MTTRRWHPITFQNSDLEPYRIDSAGNVWHVESKKHLAPLTIEKAAEFWRVHCARGLREITDDCDRNRLIHCKPSDLVEPFVLKVSINDAGIPATKEFHPASPLLTKWLYMAELPEQEVFGLTDFRLGKKPKITINSEFPPEEVSLVGDVKTDWYGVVNTHRISKVKFYSVFHGPSLAALFAVNKGPN